MKLKTHSLVFYKNIPITKCSKKCNRQVKVGHFRQLILGQKRQAKMGQLVFIH